MSEPRDDIFMDQALETLHANLRLAGLDPHYLPWSIDQAGGLWVDGRRSGPAGQCELFGPDHVPYFLRWPHDGSRSGQDGYFDDRGRLK